MHSSGGPKHGPERNKIQNRPSPIVIVVTFVYLYCVPVPNKFLQTKYSSLEGKRQSSGTAQNVCVGANL